MMEKDWNEQELDKLIQDWTDELLPPDLESQITDSIIDFVNNDDSEINVNDLIESKIHQLAIEEKQAKRRNWKIFFSSVAAASVVMLIIASIFIKTNEPGIFAPANNILAVENEMEEIPIASNSELPMILADSSKIIMAKAAIKSNTEVPPLSNRERTPQENESDQNESTPEQNLTETIVEINAGIVNMMDNAKECLNMAKVDLLPMSIFAEGNESKDFELTFDEFASSESLGEMQEVKIFETNLINTFNEFRKININLKFETDNKKTEI